MNDFLFVDLNNVFETILEFPVHFVWPRLLDQQSWMKGWVIESIAGVRHTEGEIKKVVAPDADPTGTPVKEFLPFYFETVRVIPYRKVVYKAYTKQRTGEYGFSGFEILSLNDFGRRSTLSVELYLEFQSAKLTSDKLHEFVRLVKEGSATSWQDNFECLKSMLDAASAQSE